jgi:serine/threonine protein kinase
MLEDPIGQGGMGVVWRGHDRETGTPRAIKLLRPQFAADPASVARFVRERTALVKFRHPNVVTLHDMIVEGDCLALVMDLVGGGDLDAYRRTGGGTLSLGEALALTTQICEALAAAHAAGIVHRDLKPANVLLDAGQVRLADFGIARIAGESPATTAGGVIGTVAFMAPEVIRGEAPTAACDVYAAGITLYELLTGLRPFSGEVAAILHGHLETVPTRPDGVPGRLWTLMSACLSKDPAARPSAAVRRRKAGDVVRVVRLDPLGYRREHHDDRGEELQRHRWHLPARRQHHLDQGNDDLHAGCGLYLGRHLLLAAGRRGRLLHRPQPVCPGLSEPARSRNLRLLTDPPVVPEAPGAGVASLLRWLQEARRG